MQNAPHDPLTLPDDLPVPTDDGAADHLTGMTCADIALPATDGTRVNLAKLPGRIVVYAYPRTGVPGRDMPAGWDAIPGARGCTPQSCSFRDHFAALTALGVGHIHGLSTQSTAYQSEAAQRLHLPFSLLSDEKLSFAKAMRLPVFDAEGATLLKRLALVIDNGVIAKVFYPVFPPDRSAIDVSAWLSSR